MIERRAEFIRVLDSLCENIVNCGELNYDEEKMEERFLYQSSASPENIECIKNLEYGIVMQSNSHIFSCVKIFQIKKQRKFSLRNNKKRLVFYRWLLSR